MTSTCASHRPQPPRKTCMGGRAILQLSAVLIGSTTAYSNDRITCNETGVIQISINTGLWNRVLTNEVDPDCNATSFDLAADNVRYNGVRFYLPINQVFTAAALSSGTTVANPNMQLYCQFDAAHPDDNLIAYDDDGGPGLLPEFFDSDLITLRRGRAYTLIFSGPAAGSEFGNINVCLGGNAKFGVPGGFKSGDRVGYSIANAGDVNGDGYDDIIIGMPQNDETGNNAGKAAIGIQFESGFDQIYAIFGEQSGDQLGWSVSGCGDVNDDGYDEVIVGAPYNDHTASNAGAAYVYTFRNGYPEQLFAVYGSNKNDRLGSSVTGGQDLNGDLRDDFAAGAPYFDNGSNKKDAGLVRVYSGADASVLQNLVGQNAGDRFGHAIDFLAKANVSNDRGVLVGAPYNDDKGKDAGKVYLYAADDYSLIVSKKGKKAGDRFGHDVAAAGLVDGDSVTDFVVGSPFADSGALSNIGKIDVFSSATGSLLFSRKGKQANEQYGWSVNCEGDLDSDGMVDIIIGSPLYDNGVLTDAGRVEIRRANGTLLKSQNGTTLGGKFGFDVGGRDTPGGPINLCPLTFGTEPFNVMINGGLKAVFICSNRESQDPGEYPAWSSNLIGAAEYPFELPEQRPSPPRYTTTTQGLHFEDPRAADFNRDGVTDERDLMLLLADWASIDSDADLNQDGTVDAADIDAFIRLARP